MKKEPETQRPTREPMTVKSAMEKKRDLELQLLAMLQRFENASGLCVNSITLDREYSLREKKAGEILTVTVWTSIR